MTAALLSRQIAERIGNQRRIAAKGTQPSQSAPLARSSRQELSSRSSTAYQFWTMLLGILAAWLGVGLVWCLTSVPPAEVNPGYFRSSLLVVLGLCALAALAGWNRAPTWTTAGRVGVCIAAYFSYFFWSIDRARLGRAAMAVASALGLGAVAPALDASLSSSAVLPFAGAICGSALLGAAMGAMLLGHYYLTAPWMSLKPIRRLLAVIFVVVGMRAIVVGFDAMALHEAARLSGFEWGIFLVLRIGVGLVGILALTFMTVRTLQWNATQAATGILYVVVIFALAGETTAVVFGELGQRGSAGGELTSTREVENQ